MAKIIDFDTKKEYEVLDGDSIIDAAEEMGIPFACRMGSCGICKCQVEKGEDNLSPLTQEEEDLGMDSKNRLACQVKIMKGEVEISK